MEITYDEAKRQWTLLERELDFVDVAKVLDGPLLTLHDDRFAYPEPRYQTYGLLNERMVMFAWTETERGIRVISMRRCNEREQRRFAHRLG
ncbi:BrnT family toxin [Novosphingobium sp.]|uniref:BrnT family toxin n=1 Tax=Novosphingobium sp. TaxID=1874826 RepID=UPI003BAC3FD8